MSTVGWFQLRVTQNTDTRLQSSERVRGSLQLEVIAVPELCLSFSAIYMNNETVTFYSLYFLTKMSFCFHTQSK